MSDQNKSMVSFHWSFAEFGGNDAFGEGLFVGPNERFTFSHFFTTQLLSAMITLQRSFDGGRTWATFSNFGTVIGTAETDFIASVPQHIRAGLTDSPTQGEGVLTLRASRQHVK